MFILSRKPWGGMFKDEGLMTPLPTSLVQHWESQIKRKGLNNKYYGKFGQMLY